MTKICFRLLRVGIFESIFSVEIFFCDKVETAFSSLAFLSAVVVSSASKLVSTLLFSPSRESFRFREMSCMSLRESLGESESEFWNSTLCHLGDLCLQEAIRAKYVLQCSGHENKWMFFRPFCLHLVQRCLSETSFKRALDIACWS